MSDTITVNTSTTNITLSVFSQPNNISVNVVEAGAVWGSINGTITNQTDLVNYINSSGNSSPYIFAANNTSILPINGTNVITVSGTNSVIAGGCSNTVSGAYSNIGGGRTNNITGDYSNIGGGWSNTVSGYNSIIGGGGGNCICAGYGYNVIVGGQNNTLLSGYNSFIGGGYYNTASSYYSNVVGGVNNRASGFSSFIAAGSNNDSNNKDNTFILGSNITAISANFTYVNNLSTSGSICAGTFYGDGSNLVGASLPGQADINTLVQNTSGNWNDVYSLVSTTTATTFNVNNLTTSGKVGVKQAPLYFDTDAANIGNSYGTFGIGASNDISITPNNNLVLSPAVGYNVGVNTSAPNQKLTVSGNISSSNVIYDATGNSNNWNNSYTSYKTTSASFATTLSLSATTLKVYDKAVTYTVALSDNNSAIHLNTTSASISALFPSNLTEGFSVALMNTGTNYLYLSSALPLVSLGNSLSGKGSGAFTYVHSGSLYAVGRF